MLKDKVKIVIKKSMMYPEDKKYNIPKLLNKLYSYTFIFNFHYQNLKGLIYPTIYYETKLKK